MSNETKKNGKYQELADKLADLIENNEAPWRKEWSGNGYLPYNIKSNQTYRGINMLNLMTSNYQDPRWLTFIQAQELGARIRPGEKGDRVQSNR